MRFVFLMSVLSVVSFAELPGEMPEVPTIPLATCGSAPEMFKLAVEFPQMTYVGTLTVQGKEIAMTCTMPTEDADLHKIYDCTEKGAEARAFPQKRVEVYGSMPGQPQLDEARVIEVLESGEQKTTLTLTPCQPGRLE